MRCQKPVRHPTGQSVATRIFVETGGRNMALLISLALWYGVTGQRKPTTIRALLWPLIFVSGNMAISKSRAQFEVTLTAARALVPSSGDRGRMFR